VLSALTTDGGIVLLPHSAEPERFDAADWTRLSSLLSAVGRAAGAPVTAGAVIATPADTAAAVTTAQDLLCVAKAAHKPPGLYQIDDLLLEFQMSRPSPARDRLAALLAPLRDDDELMQTLETYLRCGNRRSAAAELHVHPNTVDYRLNKVSKLTGLDPSHPGELAVLNAAWAALA
jgi:sugar diacid utilization regulator